MGSLRERMDKWGTCFGEGLGPATTEVAQLPVQLPEGLPPLRLGFCVDKVRQPLHFGQVQLPIGKRPPGELACLRRSKPWHAAQGLQDAAHHCRASVHVELHAVLTGETPGTWEPEDQCAVQRLPGAGVAEEAQAGVASRGQVSGCRENPEGVAAGGAAGPDHRDAAAALARA